MYQTDRAIKKKGKTDIFLFQMNQNLMFEDRGPTSLISLVSISVVNDKHNKQ
jgi:hypothetical protein